MDTATTDPARGGKVTAIALARPQGESSASGIKHRAAERFTLMLRTAKLISSHGEYACVIRDVSTTGVRLRLFHGLPAGQRLALMLGNGECYFVEAVWEHEREAGFRFSAPINVAAFMAEASPYPRRQLRLALDLPATLSIREFSSPVMIRDLSQQGARIESDRALSLDQHLRLKAHHLAETFAAVRWKKGSAYGVVFQRSFRLDELAQIAWAVGGPAERQAMHEHIRRADAPAVAQLRAG